MKREGREESHILMDKTQTGYMEEVAFQWGLWDAQASRANPLGNPEKRDIFSKAHLSKTQGSGENIMTEDQLCSV